MALYDEEIAAEADPVYQQDLRDLRAQLADAAAVVTENRDLSIAGYREILDYLGTDVDPDMARTARAVLARKLTEAGNTPLRDALMASASDAAGLEIQPDMDAQEFLEMLQTR